MKPKPQIIEVWGDYACFSRPELKVERFSYPIITPSAARGIFDAIYCKPNKDKTQAQFRWQITRIELLAPISYIALRRNEVGSVASVVNLMRWMKEASKAKPILIEEAQQRQTMALKNVRYRLTAEIRPFSGHESKQPSLESQFIRRAMHGKCFHQPCFGCREFPAYFRYLSSMEREAPPINYTQDLGLMLYDVFDLRIPNDSSAPPFISVFRAVVRNGVLNIPNYESNDILKPGVSERGRPDAS